MFWSNSLEINVYIYFFFIKLTTLWFSRDGTAAPRLWFGFQSVAYVFFLSTSVLLFDAYDYTTNPPNFIKYLVTHIDNKRTLSKQFKHALIQVQGAKFKVYPLLNNNSTLSIRTKLYANKTYMKSIIFYVYPRWTWYLSSYQ